MCVQYDEWFRENPSLRFLTASQIKDHWTIYIKQILDGFKDTEHPLYLKIKENPFNIQTEDLKQVSLKENFSNKEVWDEFKKNIEKHNPQNATLFEENYKLFSELGNQFIKKWKEIKNQKSYLQIQDLELLTLEIIEKKPSQIEAFSKEWDQWFIDEYQDMSSVQEKLLNHLFKQAQRVWTVGDPQQSIYFFRNADPKVFQRRKNQSEFEEKTENFRSTPELVSFFNDFFKNRFLPMKAQRETSNSQLPVAHFLESSFQNEALALRLNEILKENISEENICILVSRNEDVKDICNFLKKLKFPVQLHSVNHLNRSLMDLLFLLRFLNQPLDNKNLIGWLRTPYFFLNDKHLISLKNSLSKNQKYLWVELKKQKHSISQSLSQLLQMSSQKGYSETLLHFIETHSFLKLSLYQDPTGEHEHQIWQFIYDLKEKEKKQGFQLSQFIEQKLNQTKFYHVDKSSSSGVIQKGFIQVMTIHQSKGLEFDYIILPYLDKPFVHDARKDRFLRHLNDLSFSLKDEKNISISPLEKYKGTQEKKESEQDEKERVLYVAMTRAKENITFIYPQEVKKTNTWLSRFSYFQNVHELTKNSSLVRVKKLEEIPKQECIKKTPLLSKPLCSYSKMTPLNLPLKTSLPLNLSIFEGLSRGKTLHQHLEVLAQIGDSFLHQIQDKDLKEALIFVKNLKEPPMEELLKQKPEWEFIFKDSEAKIKNIRIDLWGEVNEQIWIVDYKSSLKFSKETWTQLKTYGSILRKIYPEKKIFLCAIHPFKKDVRIQPY